MAMVATASDYAQALKEKNKDLFGVSEWEKYFLQPTQQYFETAVQTEQNKAAYDISGAYSAYKKQQMQLMQQDLLSEGFKKKQEQNLGTQYETAVNQISQQASENINKINETYKETMALAESDLLAKGEEYTKFESALQKYAEERGFNPDYWKTDYLDELGRIVTSISKTGTADIAELMYDAGTEDVDDFRKWLSSNYEDVYDFYSTNLGDINAMYGIHRNYRGGDSSEYTKARDIENRIRTITSNNEDYLSEWDKRVINEMNRARPSGMSDEEYLDYLTEEYKKAESRARTTLAEEHGIDLNNPNPNVDYSALDKTIKAYKGQYRGKGKDTRYYYW